MHKSPPDVDFESSESRQNQNLEIFLICIFVLCFKHEKLFEYMCMMNVRDQTRQAFVARTCPFRDGTSKFVHGP